LKRPALAELNVAFGGSIRGARASASLKPQRALLISVGD
jgi:hypothetical protein